MSQPYRESNQSSPPPTPRWVKVSATIVIILVLLVAILHLTGNSLGGPGSHSFPMGHTGQQP